MEQYLSDDIANGRVKTLAQLQAEQQQQQQQSNSPELNLPNLPPSVESVPSLPPFESSALDLANNADRISLSDFLEAETATVTSSGTSNSDRIMQVDGVNEVLAEFVDNRMDTAQI